MTELITAEDLAERDAGSRYVSDAEATELRGNQARLAEIAMNRIADEHPDFVFRVTRDIEGSGTLIEWRRRGKTPLRNIRVPDSTWLPALARARREGTTVSAVVRGKLEDYGQEEVEEQRDE